LDHLNLSNECIEKEINLKFG